MAVGYGENCPKPVKGSSRKARKTARQRDERAFRDAVWARSYLHCEHCGRGPLTRTTNVLDRWAGHVAHNRGRNVAPEDKYNPDAATLQCSRCHLASHSMRFA